MTSAAASGEVESALDAAKCPRPRRRGSALEDAILAAAFAELSEVGYAALSVEAVAARARTGKASIYRRWPTKDDLVMDALLAELPSPDEVLCPGNLPDSVTTRDALHRVARKIAAALNSPAGAAVRAVKCELAADPKLAKMVDDRFQEPRRQALLELLRRGVARGEVRPEAVTTLVADVLPAVLMHRVMLQGVPASERMIRDIMDQVLIPIVATR